MKSQGSYQPQSAVLSQVQLFAGLTPAELEQVYRTAVTKTTASGGFIFQEGDPAERIYVLIQGRLRLTQVTPEGQQVIHRMVTPVEEFALISVLSEATYPVSAQAVEECTSLSWDRQAMNTLIARVPQISFNALTILADRIREFQDRLRELATERVERRIARTLLRLVRQAGKKVPEGVLIDLPLSRQDLAEMTGTTLFTVSRTISSWESKGIIQSGREKIIIKFPHGLVQIAEDLPALQRRNAEDSV